MTFLKRNHGPVWLGLQIGAWAFGLVKLTKPVSPWKPMETAPQDGRWFLVLRSHTLVGGGKPHRAIPDLLIVQRQRSIVGSPGYWSSIHGNSVADSYMQHGLWADLDALPLDTLYARYNPPPLPVPGSQP